MEDQERRRLYQEGFDRLRKLMQEQREQQEREREDRLRSGESMIG
jgi:hypothetical protein